MLVKVNGSALIGVDAVKIIIEVNELSGTKYFIVGLPDNAVKESLQRVESAIKEMGYKMPRRKLVVNLSPADIKKTGTAFDLPIAIGILGATQQIKRLEKLQDYILMGELNLDGRLSPIKGTIAIAILAAQEGFKGIIVPYENLAEAQLVEGIEVYGAKNLKEVIQFIESDTREISTAVSYEKVVA